MLSLIRRYPATFFFAWTAIISVLMLIPGNVIPRLTEWSDLFTWDKIVHVTLFCIEVILLSHALLSWVKTENYSSLIGLLALAFLLGIVFGGSLEILQWAMDIGRSGNIVDFVADSIGCLLGFLLSLSMVKRVP